MRTFGFCEASVKQPHLAVCGRRRITDQCVNCMDFTLDDGWGISGGLAWNLDNILSWNLGWVLSRSLDKVLSWNLDRVLDRNLDNILSWNLGWNLW